MNKYLIPLLLVASVGGTSIAMAADAKGTIKSMDAKACTVTLDNKAVYQFAPKCDFSKLKAGEKVSITYTAKGKTNDATAITAG